MTIEVATYVNDLQPVNPTSTDQVSQGDDHLRLIKQVLQNTFLNGTRAFTIPGAYAVSSTSTLAKSQGEGTIYVATASGAITLTLPTLVALDAGWKCNFVKTSSDANPIFIKPPSGTINSGGLVGLAQARRCIPGVASTAIWDGANWFITRVLALPIGSLVDVYQTALPAGYEWPAGGTLSSAANYPEYFATFASISKPDLRGYISATLDNLGGTAAGHLPTTYIASTTFGAVGGADRVTLAIGNLPSHQHGVSITDTRTWSGTIPWARAGVAAATGVGASSTDYNQNGSTGIGVGVASGSISGSDGFVGSGTAFTSLQPTMMLSKILVVE